MRMRKRHYTRSRPISPTPGLWHWEMANALTTLERKGRIRNAIEIYADVAGRPIEVELLDYRSSPRATLEIELPRRHKLSIYDAAYLAQAKALSFPLATLDSALVRAARSERVFFEVS